MDGSWKYLPDFLWDIRDATVACRELGYETVVSSKKGNAAKSSTPTEVDRWSYYLRCSGKEGKLSQCPSSRVYVSRSYVAITCKKEHRLARRVGQRFYLSIRSFKEEDRYSPRSENLDEKYEFDIGARSSESRLAMGSSVRR